MAPQRNIVIQFTGETQGLPERGLFLTSRHVGCHTLLGSFASQELFYGLQRILLVYPRSETSSQTSSSWMLGSFRGGCSKEHMPPLPGGGDLSPH